VLLRDYKSGGDVKIVFYLASEDRCQARLVPVQSVRKRLGSLVVNDPSGLTGGDPRVDLNAFVFKAKTFTLSPGGSLPGQRPGDGFTVGIAREPDKPSDTLPLMIEKRRRPGLARKKSRHGRVLV